jgi:hypothetical protein
MVPERGAGDLSLGAMRVMERAEEVAQAEWRRFLDEFSRAHAGWLVTVEEIDPARGPRELAREIPLSGICADLSRGQPREITILAGARDEWTHRIGTPARLKLRRTSEGAEEGIETESADGVRTVVRFRSAVLPETVDGMLPER